MTGCLELIRQHKKGDKNGKHKVKPMKDNQTENRDYESRQKKGHTTIRVDYNN